MGMGLGSIRLVIKNWGHKGVASCMMRVSRREKERYEFRDMGSSRGRETDVDEVVMYRDTKRGDKDICEV